MQRNLSFATENGNGTEKLDDDDRAIRTGTLVTASAHIVTAVIGSGVLSLAWAMAQLGWVAGPIALLTFSLITWFTSVLLADCYRHPLTGTRNHTYSEVVGANLGGIKIQLCGLAQYTTLTGASIGYTITTAISMAAIKRSDCFHKHGHAAGCHASNNLFIMIFGAIQIVLSQIPNINELSMLSIIASVMSFTYSTIGLGLSIAKIAGGAHVKTSLTGVYIGDEVSGSQKIWSCFQAIGNIAFAYAYSPVLVEIQDTLKSSPPENMVMRKATSIGISISTLFYMLCGVLGYAAFGNNAPGNLLTGFGFYEPFWLVDFANLCITVHLLGAYQVFGQPVHGFVESWFRKKWPQNGFISREYPIPTPYGSIFNLNFFRLVWRTAYVVFTTVMAMVLPFFNDFLGLIGAATFWPLAVYFPIEMYISRKQIRRFSRTWFFMELLSILCLIVSLLAAAGSIQGLIKSVQTFKPFQSIS